MIFRFCSVPQRLILLAGGLLLLALTPPTRADQTVLTVNQTPVAQAECIFFMEQERPAVFQYFYEHHRLADGTNFWNQVRGKTTPKAMLRQNTIRRLIREKVEQKVFLDFGLTTNISYPALLDQLASLNNQRQSAAERHEVLYGPVGYSQLIFYGNWKSTLQLRAKEKMADERLQITDRELINFYRLNNRFFRSSEKRSLDIFSLNRDSLTKNEANSLEDALVAKSIFQRAKAGQSAAQILQAFVPTNSLQVTHEQFDELTRDRLGELFSDDNTLHQITNLKNGHCIQLPQTGGRIQIVRCNTKTPASILPLEQVRELVRRRYLDEHYDQWIDSLANSALVTVDQKALDALLP